MVVTGSATGDQYAHRQTAAIDGEVDPALGPPRDRPSATPSRPTPAPLSETADGSTPVRLGGVPIGIAWIAGHLTA
jgi:hypothetical protein